LFLLALSIEFYIGYNPVFLKDMVGGVNIRDGMAAILTEHGSFNQALCGQAVGAT
jgi:hypothetical protein